jgi:hypothetical protein
VAFFFPSIQTGTDITPRGRTLLISFNLQGPRILPATEPCSASNNTKKCFYVTEMPFKVGSFNVDTPGVQLAFRNQLIGSEVKKIERIIEGFLALSQEEEVAESNKMLYSNVSEWLKADYLKTIQIFKDALKDITDKMDI